MTDKTDRMALQKRLAELADISHEVYWSDTEPDKRKAALDNLAAIPQAAADLAKAIKRDATTTKRRRLRAERQELAELQARVKPARRRRA